MQNLTIYEKLFLILMKNREGTMPFGVNYQFGLAGAILAELLMNDNVQLQKKRWGLFVVPSTGEWPQDSLLSHCLKIIMEKKRHARLSTWVSRFSGIKDLKIRVGEQLVRKGILKEEEERILILFTRKIFPEVNPVPEQQLLTDLRNILSEKGETREDLIVLISILNHLNALKYIYSRSEIKIAKNKIKELIRNEPSGRATGEAIQAVQAAVMVAAVLPAIVATTSAQ